MRVERQNQQGELRTLVVVHGVEISVGRVVPVLQHPDCVGLEGKVVEIDAENRSYRIVCTTCGRGGIVLDVRTLVG